LLTRDPVDTPSSPYVYVEGRPLTHVDPDGRFGILAALAPLLPSVVAAAEAAIVYTVATVVAVAVGEQLAEEANSYLADRAEKTRKRDTGLVNVPDDEVSRKARDRTLTPKERQRYVTEEKARGIRNKAKRGGRC
jgi:hypothetical protein